MSSRRTGRVGAQRPRVALEPRRAYTDGPDACALASEFGMDMDEWQALILDAWLGRDERDRFTALSCGLSVPRQNGKNAVIEVRELYGLVATGEKFLHTAHEVKTARKAFLRLASFFDNVKQYPELAEMVVSIRRTNGQEGIYLNNGGTIEFSARSRGAARGFTVDTVVFDEAQELTDDQVEAMMSTMAAAPSGVRQLIYTGTPPGPGSPGTVFPRVRRSGIEGSDPHLAWHEWSVEEIGDVSDRSRWYDTNPALGIRLDEDFTEAEMRTLTPDGFARERLGWWASTALDALVSEDEWSALLTDDPPIDGKYAIGVKFSVDGSRVAYAAAVKPKDGKPYVELIEVAPLPRGTAWLADWLVENKSQIAVAVIDGRSNVDNLVSRMNENGFPKRGILVPGTSGMVAASTRMLNAIRERSVEHIAQKQLDDSVLHSNKRSIGTDGAWAWGASGDHDPTPIEAASLALWGVMTTKRNPNRKARVL